jgi:hypothetical protein
VYRTVQAIGNSQFGGVHEGLFSAAYENEREKNAEREIAAHRSILN